MVWKMRCFRMLLAICLTTPAFVLHAASFRLVSIADTTDLTIGSGAAANLNLTTGRFQQIAATIGLPFSHTSVSGTEFGCRRIIETLGTLQTDPGDIVVFYYSGHGWRKERRPKASAGSTFPLFYCPDDAGITYGLEDAAAAIRRLRPRLAIYVADTCNVPASLTPPVVAAPPIRQDSRREALERLFLKPRGEIMMSASKPNEFAWYDQNTGGMFTKQLLRSLDRAIGPDRPWLWIDLAQLARQEIIIRDSAGKKVTSQHPQVSLTNLRESLRPD